MSSAIANIETTAQARVEAGEMDHERTLPSGRSIHLKITSAGEELQIRSPQGALEVRITLGDDGPVVHLSGARLELESPDTIALQCRHLEVNTEEGIHLKSAGDIHMAGQEMRVKTSGDIHLNGDIIRLNC